MDLEAFETASVRMERYRPREGAAPGRWNPTGDRKRHD